LNAYFSTTIWGGLLASSSPVREEIFAPCLYIGPVDHEYEPIAMTKLKPHVLAGTVSNTNGAHASQVAVSRRSGMVWVNC